MLIATVVLVAVESIRHFTGVHGPVLPASWCRSTSMVALLPLIGRRWFTSWQADPLAFVVVAALGGIYLAGVLAVARHGRRWPLRHSACFALGLAVVLVATCSSIGVYDMAMFSMHMLGHLALIMVAPLFLALGRPMTLALHATRNPWHGRIRRVVRSRALALWFCPPIALSGYVVVIVGTHLTGLMDVIMSQPWAGQFEHLAYLVVGYQFFVLVVGDEPLRWRLSMPAKQLLLAVAMAVDTFTGVILLQTTQPIAMTGLSPAHVDPLGQTRLGGAIMWVGGDAIMVLVMVGVALSWLRRPEHRRRAANSWLEQTRRANLAEHAFTGTRAANVGTVRNIDDDDRARDAYNAWLRTLSGTHE